MKDFSFDFNNIIIGRIKPRIYAFSTKSIPNYLKIGDTYRGVSIRLDEWGKYYKEIRKVYDWLAIVNEKEGKEDVFFRDYSVHKYLASIGKKQLKQEDISPDIHYSNEFYLDVSVEDIENAIKDIKQAYKNHENRYQFYKADPFDENKLKYTKHNYTYVRNKEYGLRDIQKNAVDKFMNVKDDRKNLLMYAVMRFGKSFTAMHCALAMEAKIVVVVSAKDVREEWKSTVESHQAFKKYVFKDQEALKRERDEDCIQKILDENKRVVVFLTLQDLQGNAIKEKHKEILKKDVDLLIIDETHFGARAEKFGQVLRQYGKAGVNASCHKKDSEEDNETIEANEEIRKYIKADVCLHLSGTPYRILMGNEFDKDDIIANCQFSDIVKEQEKWYAENIVNNETGEEREEWDNPYYGFPQMIRFAFDPNESSRKKIEQLKKDGHGFAFAELLKPRSIKKTNDGSDGHKKFINEKEVLELLQVIDGSRKEEGILGFLDYDKIKTGEMCRHMVFVLPFCASCDAMEELIKTKTKEGIFLNLKDYEIINISGVDNPNAYKTNYDVKAAIYKFAYNGQKTLTLTVNRMLTGSTVHEWDTMVFLKDTASPQEYDQAIFRLQNPYIVERKDEQGRIIKDNMKPQTLLVDFDPMRMFSIQEQKAQVECVISEKYGNEKVKQVIDEELKISPIIWMNHEKLGILEASDIMNEVSNYSRNRGVAEEVLEIPIDDELLEIKIIREAIERENELGSKAGFTINAYKNDSNGVELDVPSGENIGRKPSQEKKQDKEIDIIKQFRAYYARILFYAFLTKDIVDSLKDILSTINDSDNSRIASNLGLDKKVLKAISKGRNQYALSMLDYKIQHLCALSHDANLKPIERAEVAIRKFNKLGVSEVVTPSTICDRMVDMLPEDELIESVQKGHKILDLAGKTGEFATAIYKKLKQLGVEDSKIIDCIFTVPTSNLTYEFTLWVYKALGLNPQNIAKNLNTYSLLKKTPNGKGIDYEKVKALLTQNKPFCNISINDEITKKGNKMKFSYVIGNPPYQQEAENKSEVNGQTRSRSIFQHFQTAADKIATDASVLIYPGGRWIQRSGKGMESFGYDQINDVKLKEVYFYPDSHDVFQNAAIADGISIVVKKMSKTEGGFNYIFCNKNTEQEYYLQNPGENIIPLNPKDLDVSNKLEQFIKSNGLTSLHDRIHPQKLFAIESDFVEKNKSLVRELTGATSFNPETEVKLYANDKAGKSGRTKWFICPRKCITTNREYIDKWKVVVSSANAGGQKRDNQLEIIDNASAFGRSRVALASFETEHEAENFFKYVSCNIIRFAFLLTDEALTTLAYKVPDLGDYTDNNKLIDFACDIDNQLMKKMSISSDEMDYIKTRINSLR